MIRVVGKRGKGSFESQLDEAAKGLDFVRIDCTSNNKDEVMNHGLSPFYLGPVECYDGLISQTFERAWQCAKVYPWMVDAAGDPDARYYAWRDDMWAREDFSNKIEIRFPAGKGNARKCMYAWWKVVIGALGGRLTTSPGTGMIRKGRCRPKLERRFSRPAALALPAPPRRTGRRFLNFFQRGHNETVGGMFYLLELTFNQCGCSEKGVKERWQ